MAPSIKGNRSVLWPEMRENPPLSHAADTPSLYSPSGARSSVTPPLRRDTAAEVPLCLAYSFVITCMQQT